MKLARLLIVPLTAAFTFATLGCGGDTGPDASKAIGSTAPPVQAAGKVEVKRGRMKKSMEGVTPSAP